MSEADRSKWNERYSAGAYSTRSHPSTLLVEYATRTSAEGAKALDIACGAGRNALYLAQLGFAVDAIDISDVGLARLQHSAQQQSLLINTHGIDLLEQTQLPGDGYHLIVMTRFVAQALTTHLPTYLAPGGLLVVEQHLQIDSKNSALPSDLAGPSSARFRLPPGTLRGWINACGLALETLHDYEGLVREPDGQTALLAQYVARRMTS